jgi:hypothetical protein
MEESVIQLDMKMTKLEGLHGIASQTLYDRTLERKAYK